MSNYPPGYNGHDGPTTLHFRCVATIDAEGYRPGKNGFDDGYPCDCEWSAPAKSFCGQAELDDERKRYCPECGAEGQAI